MTNCPNRIPRPGGYIGGTPLCQKDNQPCGCYIKAKGGVCRYVERFTPSERAEFRAAVEKMLD